MKFKKIQRLALIGYQKIFSCFLSVIDSTESPLEKMVPRKKANDSRGDTAF